METIKTYVTKRRRREVRMTRKSPTIWHAETARPLMGCTYSEDIQHSCVFLLNRLSPAGIDSLKSTWGNHSGASR